MWNWLRSGDITSYSMKHHFCAMGGTGFVCSPLVSSLLPSLTLSLISYLESNVVLQDLVISRHTNEIWQGVGWCSSVDRQSADEL